MRRLSHNRKFQMYLNGWFFSIFLMLFWSYHYTALEILHISSLMILAIELAALSVPFFLTAKTSFLHLTPLSLWLVFWLGTMMNNYYIQRSSYSRPVAFFLTVVLAYFLQFSADWYTSFKKCILFFSWEHFILGWTFLIFGSFYKSRIIPLFPPSKRADLIQYHNQHIIIGITEHYSTSGIYFAIACIACFSIWLQDYKNKKNIFIFLLMLASLLMTQKRGPLLFAVLACVIVFFLYHKRTIKTILKFAFGIMLCCLGFYIAIQIFPQLGSVFERFKTKSNSSSSHDPLSGRGKLYALAIQMFKEKPVLGGGWGQYRKYYRVNQGSAISDIVEYSAHNIYLQVFAETGIIGGILFVSLLLGGMIYTDSILKKRLQAKERKENELFALTFSAGMQLYFIFYGLTGNPIYDPQCFIPYFISLAVPFSVSMHQGE